MIELLIEDSDDEIRKKISSLKDDIETLQTRIWQLNRILVMRRMNRESQAEMGKKLMEGFGDEGTN